MRWAEIAPPESINWMTRDDPSAPAPTEVVLEVLRSGLCGTDIRRWEGRPLNPGQWLNQGHEISGRVIATGPDVATCHVGDRVAIQWSPYVGGGAWADYLTIDHRGVHVLPDSISTDVGILAEPIATCLRAIDLAQELGIRSGSTALILGGGPAGLLMTILAQLSGYSRVIVSEPVRERRALASRLSPDLVLDPGADDVAAIAHDLTAGIGIDAVFDCASSAASYRTGIDSLRRGGALLGYGLAPVGEGLTLSPSELHRKGVQIAGATGWGTSFPRAVQWLAARPELFGQVITTHMPLENLQEALELANTNTVGKICLEGSPSAGLFGEKES